MKIQNYPNKQNNVPLIIHIIPITTNSFNFNGTLNIIEFK